MATILNSLKSITSYPIPRITLETVSVGRELELETEVTVEIVKSQNYKLAKADLLMWLSDAPDVSQGGQSYGFTDEQRLKFRNSANAIYGEYEDQGGKPKSIYGYKGSRL